jgi:hypothetical protein
MAPLLNAFLQLAKDETLDPTTCEALAERVQAFVTSWGPLWLCRNASHRIRCVWSSEGVLERPENPCTWVPTEEIREFHEHAWRVRAVLEAAAALHRGESIPQKLRPWLMSVPDNNALEEQWEALGLSVNDYLWTLGGPHIALRWREKPHFKLEMHGGMSFLGAVWLQVAQLLCNAKGLLQCDDCHQFYVREERRPKSGQPQYCLSCKKGDKAAKRQHARRRRTLERQARQLYAQGRTCEEISQQLKPSAGKIKVDAETVQRWVLPKGSKTHH